MAKNTDGITRGMRSCLSSFVHRFVHMLANHFPPPGQLPLIYGDGLQCAESTVGCLFDVTRPFLIFYLAICLAHCLRYISAFFPAFSLTCVFIFYMFFFLHTIWRILSECILTFYFGILLGLLFSRLSGIPSGDMEVWLSRSPQHVQLAMWSSVPMLCAILAHHSVTNVYPSSKGNILSFRAHARMVSFGGLCETRIQCFFFKTNFW